MKSPRHSSNRAFSLIELLVVIGILAILATLAIPAIFDTLNSSAVSKNLRNAQTLSSMSQAAVAAGFSGTNTVPGWIDLLTNGITVTNMFGDTLGYFRVDELSAGDVSGATNYLTVEQSKLVYLPQGTP